MAEAGVNLVTVGVFSWSQAAARAWRADRGLAGPGARPAGRGGDRRRPGHGHGVAAALARHGAPRDPAGHGGRAAARARRAAALLPERARVPRGRRRPRRTDGAALRRPPGRGHVARRQRVRLPRPRLLLRDRRRRRSAAGSGRGTARSTGSTKPGAARCGARTTRAGTRSSRRAPRPPSPTRHSSSTSPGSAPAELLACYRAEREVLAAHSPGTPVTTNFMGLFRAVDQFRWAAELGRRLRGQLPRPGRRRGLPAVRHGLRPDPLGGRRAAPWMLMEQAPSAVNWRAVNVPKAPGQYRGLSLQAVARGSDAVLSFQWRAAATGAEKFHSGMLPHAGTDSRVWREVAGLGADLGRLAPVAGSPVRAAVRAAARLGELVGARARLAPEPAAPRRPARRVLPAAVRRPG